MPSGIDPEHHYEMDAKFMNRHYNEAATRWRQSRGSGKDKDRDRDRDKDKAKDRGEK